MSPLGIDLGNDLRVKNPTYQFFVDEAGDSTLFNAKGHVIVGTDGCSNHFILGSLKVQDADRLRAEITSLRQSLLADPYFKNVPSMERTAKKTWVQFHAKDDLPEVRREMFHLLLRHTISLIATVKNKHALVEEVTKRNLLDPHYRYNQNELYDLMVQDLFHGRVHRHSKYNLIFASRGNSDRTDALRNALKKTNERYCALRGVIVDTEHEVQAVGASTDPILQAADYMLWATQRFFEKREDRYLEMMWGKIRLITVLDNPEKGYGKNMFSKKKPLRLEMLEG